MTRGSAGWSSISVRHWSTRPSWGRWAQYLGVPRLTFFAAMGAVIAARRPHTDVFDLFRPGFRLEDETQRKAASGLPWGFDEQDLYPDALPALHDLRASGYRLAVMANQPVEATRFCRLCRSIGSARPQAPPKRISGCRTSTRSRRPSQLRGSEIVAAQRLAHRHSLRGLGTRPLRTWRHRRPRRQPQPGGGQTVATPVRGGAVCLR